MKEKSKKKKWWFAGAAVVILLLLPVLWLSMVRLEGEKPEVIFEQDSPYIGKSHDFKISITDPKSGLRKIWIAMIQNGKEIVLAEKDFQPAGILGGGKIKSESLNIPFEPEKHGFADGKAILRLAVWDYSWRGWWQGNQVYLEKNLVIDTRPPQIEMISTVHNLAQGGAGLVIYRTSEGCRLTGVQVGDNFFPAHGGYYKDPLIQLAFIGLGYQQGPETPIWVKAVDEAQNSARAAVKHYIRKKVFKEDNIQISDRFLDAKVPEFASIIAPDSSSSPVDKFLKINRDLRQANYQQISEVTQTTAAAIYWKGKFLRMPGAAKQAGFADHRTYKYKGKIIDRQVHLGLDLASVAHAPVPAANSGVVAFSGFLGIYGNTVLIDHGLGLFSMYAHLNSSDVSKGQAVSKGDILGHTGSTGLAGGDHLHFSILVHRTFVNPIEWWDPNWIENNILSKIQAVPSTPVHK